MVTGKDLIKFIQDNKLENMEIMGTFLEGEVQFGQEIRLNEGKDELVYLLQIKGEGHESDVSFLIELCHIKDEFANIRGYDYISTDEALRIRGIH